MRAIFYGLGSDGTVGANKNSIKIIGEETPHWAQGYFVFDSKKSGAMTISHLRFWAYDIGYGGLDHVLASGANVNVLVLDTEVYSNTGGQQSKATPIAAAAKFAVAGKDGGKKDLGLMAMAYGHVYVAQVAFGAEDSQTLKAFLEAEAYPGPSLVIAYSQCIAHGYDMACGIEHQRLAADTGYWPLYRFDPRREARGEPALVLDSPRPKSDIAQLMALESRFQLTDRQDHDHYEALVERARQQIAKRISLYQKLAERHDRVATGGAS